MISSSVGSGHPGKYLYEISMNTYQDEGTSPENNFNFLFSPKLRLFQDSFIYGEATSSHFFWVTTISLEQLLF